MPVVNCNRYALPLSGLLAVGCATLGLSQATAASPPPTVSLAATPKLYVATGSRPVPNTPVAWTVFQTVQHVNPRLIVVRVHDRSGRSYRIAGNNCVRSTIVTDDGRTDLKPGHRYTVDFYSRSGIGTHAERKLVATRKLIARTFPVAKPATPRTAERQTRSAEANTANNATHASPDHVLTRSARGRHLFRM